jgi:ankyrin repeat domain-containing protein 11/12
MANKQQQKKSSVGELKSKPDSEESNTLASSSSSSSSAAAAPSDVYEFVSTPKHSSCSSGDENPAKESFDEKSGTDSDTPVTSVSSTNTGNLQQKRTLGGDLQDGKNDESISPAESDDSKRKKRKDSDLIINKDTGSVGKGTSTANRVTSRVGQKPPGPASKTMGLLNKGSSSVERKGSCDSPKMPTKSPEGENETESADGPKVPPLKIVLQAQTTTNNVNTETQESNVQSNSTTQRSSKNGQSTINKNSSQLPYVIAAAASSNSNDSSSNSNEKEGARSQSPSAESIKSNEESSKSSNTGKSKEARILRSSQRSGDRSSNNSSPQLPASSTPSPLAAQNNETSNGGDCEIPQPISVSTTNVPVATTTTTITTAVPQTTTVSSSNSQQIQQQCTSEALQNSNELHPRKRKIKASSKDANTTTTTTTTTSNVDSKDGQVESIHPHDQPFTNCYQMYIDLRKQIEQRHRNLHAIEPRKLKGLEDYLMNRRTYTLQGKALIEPNIIIPPLLPVQMKETFIEQEKERHKLKMKHIVEKEKLVLSKEQEILRVHCKAAQMQANQPQPFSVCTIVKDDEVYNPVTPEHEEKYNNRSFFKELKDLDDKWDKIKVREL